MLCLCYGFQKEKYHGERDTEDLVKHALRHVGARVVELWTSNFRAHMEAEDRVDKPWLITFCGDGGGKNSVIEHERSVYAEQGLQVNIDVYMCNLFKYQ